MLPTCLILHILAYDRLLQKLEHYPIYQLKKNKKKLLFNKVLLYGIYDNMSAIVYNGEYGVTNTAYSTTIGYYVFKFFSEPYTLQDKKQFTSKS